MMDSFELTKFVAAVLSALLVMVGSNTAIQISQSGHGGQESSKRGYVLPATTQAAPEAKGSGEAAAGGFDAAKVAAMVATASVDGGKDVFGKCKACHTAEKGGKNGQGPNLWGIVGRARASHEGFTYSDALKAKTGNWSFADLAQFVHNPKGFAAGTKMSFAGLASAQDVADLLAYLRMQSDNPAPAPAK